MYRSNRKSPDKAAEFWENLTWTPYRFVHLNCHM